MTRPPPTCPKSPGSLAGDRLKDASLLREQCYIDGAWTGRRPGRSPIRSMAGTCKIRS